MRCSAHTDSNGGIMDDSVKLIRSCETGVKMAIVSINSALHYVTSPKLMDIMENFRDRHREIYGEMSELLRKLNGEDKDVSAMLKAMNRLTTRMRIAVRSENADIAQTMMNSCDKGIRKIADNMMAKCIFFIPTSSFVLFVYDNIIFSYFFTNICNPAIFVRNR